MTGLKIIGFCVLFIVIILAIDYSSILWKGVTAPMREEVRRDVYESSRAFNEAVVRDLAEYYRQWQDAETETEKNAIAYTAVTRFPNYDIGDLPEGPMRNWFRAERGY